MVTFYRRNLPHAQPNGAILFVTFRLVGSLPRDVLEKIRQRQLQIEKLEHSGRLTEKEVLNEQKRLFSIYDRALDTAVPGDGQGAWLFCDDRYAKIMMKCVMAGVELRRFVLHRHCIMPNHVHLLLEPLPKLVPEGVVPEVRFPGMTLEMIDNWHEQINTRTAPPAASSAAILAAATAKELEFWPLAKIMNGIKSRAAREINHLRGTSGPIFQREWFDHYVRDVDEYGRIITYIDENPVRAGLCAHAKDWKWGSAGTR